MNDLSANGSDFDWAIVVICNGLEVSEKVQNNYMSCEC